MDHSTSVDGVALSLFSSRVTAVCDEMGAILQRTALSSNIRERLDYSCAIFDRGGAMIAQAAHIPVHLGSMAYAMGDIVSEFSWQAGDQLIVNDPYAGGTHLPDVTVIAPCFNGLELLGFVANRAHHADIGADSPGSMPISKSLLDEGLLLPPQKLVVAGKLDDALFSKIINSTRSPANSSGDFSAQLSANRTGVERLTALQANYGGEFSKLLAALDDYAGQLMRAAIIDIPDGQYSAKDWLDDDGCGQRDILINLSLTITGSKAQFDFSGTAPQVLGNVNCSLPVTAAAVFYAFRCLLPPQTPACAGAMQPLKLVTKKGSLLDAEYPAAVAAGNVETSTRIVDVVLAALAKALPEKIPAASHGSMNNLAMGGSVQSSSGQSNVGQSNADQSNNGESRNWDYYETMGGGMGAGLHGGGLSAVQTHMTNTLNTPIEVLELTLPLRLREYSIRQGSGGSGMRYGGDGLVREFEFLEAASFTLLTERRRLAPWGLAGGGAGSCGVNYLNGQKVAGKLETAVVAGDRLRVETPGGGGYGEVTSPT